MREKERQGEAGRGREGGREKGEGVRGREKETERGAGRDRRHGWHARSGSLARPPPPFPPRRRVADLVEMAGAVQVEAVEGRGEVVVVEDRRSLTSRGTRTRQGTPP